MPIIAFIVGFLRRVNYRVAYKVFNGRIEAFGDVLVVSNALKGGRITFLEAFGYMAFYLVEASNGLVASS